MDGKYIYKVPGAAELSPLFLLLLKSDIIHTPEYIPRTWQLGGTRPSRDGTAVHGVAYVCHSARKCEDRLARSRVDLTAQASFLTRASAQQLQPVQAQRAHARASKHASGLGLGWLGLALKFRVGVAVAAGRGRKQSHRRGENPSQNIRLVTKPYLIETGSFLCGYI